MGEVDRRKAKALFLELLELPAESRAAFLDGIGGADPAMRRHLEDLQEAHEAAGEFLARPTGDGPAIPAPGAEEKPGQKIDHYKLLQVIGTGGFGTVYMADQEEPVRRRVALKILKLGMDSKQVVARFEAERQALALMDHPNISRVYDAGTTNHGRPYFVMELVRGVPITEYCDQAGLSTRDRLSLFNQVCRAIHHAHQKGIIHRDIKPTNILVTLHDGVPVPKVIDFGIAKATNQKLTERTLFTEYRQFVGTPEYMSPEQAEISGLDVDTRADIYSLGVLLYELLTGSQPFDMQSLLEKGYGEILRVIREVDPPRPSTRVSTMGPQAVTAASQRHVEPGLLTRQLSGDLDWIVMKSIEKDRNRRYDSAAALASDVESHLADRPVEAGPPGLAYRTRKFVRRNRVAVGAGTVAVVALLVGLAAAIAGLLEAGAQRDRALTSEEVAVRERDAASDARDEAQTAREATAAALAEREQELVRTHAARLLAESRSMLRRDPRLALALALEGGARHRGAASEEVLLEALDAASLEELVLPHGDYVQSVEMSRDGRRVVSTTRGGVTRVWSAANGTLETVLPRRQARRPYAAIAPDGRHVVLCGPQPCIWDVEEGRVRHDLSRHDAWLALWPTSEGPVYTFSPDGVRTWDALTGTMLRHVRCGSTSFFNPALGTEGWMAAGRVVTVTRQYTPLSVWDLESGKCLFRHDAPGRVLGLPSLSPDGRWAGALEADPSGGPRGSWTVRIWDVDAGKEAWHFESEEGTTGPLAFAPDAKTVAIAVRSQASGGGFVSVRDVESGEEVVRLEAKPEGQLVLRPLYDPTGRYLAQLEGGPNAEEIVVVWDLETGERVHVHRGHAETCHLLRWSADGRRLVTGSQDGTVRIWSRATGDELTLMRGHRHGLTARAVGPAPLLATAGEPDGIRVWDLDTLTLRHVLDGHVRWNTRTTATVGAIVNAERTVYSLSFHPDGSRVLSSGADGTARVVDLESGREIHVLGHGKAWVLRGCYSRDGRRIATLAEDRKVRIWDAESGERLHALAVPLPRPETPTGLSNGLMLHRAVGGPLLPGTYHLAVSRDGCRVAATAQGDVAGVWDVESGRLLHRLEAPRKHLGGLGFTGDNARVVAGLPADLRGHDDATEGRTYVWDVETGVLVREHMGCLRSLAQDDRLLVQMRPGNELRVLDFETGETIRTFTAERGRFTSAQLHEGGRLLLTGSPLGVELRDVESGEVLHRDPTGTSGRWIKGQDILLSVRRDTSIRVLRPDLPERVRRATRLTLTDAERARYGIDGFRPEDLPPRKVSSASPEVDRGRKLARARDLEARGMRDAAIGAYRNLLAAHPEYAPAWIRLGVLQGEAQLADDALEAFRRAVALDPENGLAQCRLGWALCSLHEWREGLDALRRATALLPGDSVMQGFLLEALSAAGRTQEVMRRCSDVFRRDPDAGWVYRYRAAARTLASDRGGALEDRRRALQYVPTPWEWLKLAEAAFHAGEFEESQQASRKGLELLRQRPEGVDAKAALRAHEDRERIVTLVAAWVADRMTPPDSRGKADLAGGLHVARRYADAARLYGEALDADASFGRTPGAAELYAAACSSVLAAAGPELRGRARAWLAEQLALLERQYDAADDGGRLAAWLSMRHWRLDPDLASVRDEEGLAELPEDERAKWSQLWAEVDRRIEAWDPLKDTPAAGLENTNK